MLQIEKEHKRSTLMTAKKKDLVDQIMYLEHNVNVMNNIINQQAENFKILNKDMHDRIEQKSFEVDIGCDEVQAVQLADIKKEFSWMENMGRKRG